MLANFGLFLLVALYLDSCWPGNQGISRPWWFPFTLEFWLGHRRQQQAHPPPDHYLEYLDTDVSAEARRVFGPENTDVIRVLNVIKDYGFGTKKRAVEGVSFGVPEGSLFALLGHNGAGVTRGRRAGMGLVRGLPYRRGGGGSLGKVCGGGGGSVSRILTESRGHIHT